MPESSQSPSPSPSPSPIQDRNPIHALMLANYSESSRQNSGNESSRHLHFYNSSDRYLSKQKQKKSQIFAQVTLYALIPYVITTALTESLSDQKTLEGLLCAACFSSFAMDSIKLFLNTSAHLTKDFDLYWAVDIIQAVILMVLACGIYFSHIGATWSPVGYNASMTVLGITFKIATDFVVAPYAQKKYDAHGVVCRWLVPFTPHGQHKYRWYNHLMLHSARYIILCSAMIAGSELFSKIKVADSSVGQALVDFFVLCGAHSPAAVFAAALIFNEIVGMSLFIFSGWFYDIYPTHASRLLVMIAMSAIFQAWSESAHFLKEDTYLTMFFSVTMTFLADLGMQYTVGPRLDKSVNKIIASGLDLMVENSKVALKRYGFCQFSSRQQSQLEDQENYHQMHNVVS